MRVSLQRLFKATAWTRMQNSLPWIAGSLCVFLEGPWYLGLLPAGPIVWLTGKEHRLRRISRRTGEFPRIKRTQMLTFVWGGMVSSKPFQRSTKRGPELCHKKAGRGLSVQVSVIPTLMTDRKPRGWQPHGLLKMGGRETSWRKHYEVVLTLLFIRLPLLIHPFAWKKQTNNR